MMAGAWQRFTVTSLPWLGNFAAAFVAEPGTGMVVASVLNPKGAVVTTARQTFEFAEGPAPAAFQFLVSFDQLGAWTVVLSSEVRELQRLTFDVSIDAPNTQ
jgi:hypothetical protein